MLNYWMNFNGEETKKTSALSNITQRIKEIKSKSKE